MTMEFDFSSTNLDTGKIEVRRFALSQEQLTYAYLEARQQDYERLVIERDADSGYIIKLVIETEHELITITKVGGM